MTPVNWNKAMTAAMCAMTCLGQSASCADPMRACTCKRAAHLYIDGAAAERAAIVEMLREEAASIATELPPAEASSEKPTVVWSWAMARAYRRICALADAIEARQREAARKERGDG